MKKKTTKDQTPITSVGTVNRVNCSERKASSIPAEGFEGKCLVGLQKLSRNCLETADPRH